MQTRGAGRMAAGLRVLVVDGTQGRGELMAQHLRSEGMQPTVVPTAQDAWNSLEWSPADVVLLRAGGDMAEACEMAPALARRGVVLVTASAEPVRPDVRRKALAAGVQDMLVAPFDAREMAARLDAATYDAAAAEAAPVAGRPRVPMAAAVAVEDDAKTRAEARPAALVAEEARPVERGAERGGDPPTQAEAGPPAAWAAEEARPVVRRAEPAGDAPTRAEAGPPAALVAETAKPEVAAPPRVEAAIDEALDEAAALAGLEGPADALADVSPRPSMARELEAAVDGSAMGPLAEAEESIGAADSDFEEAPDSLGLAGARGGAAAGSAAVPFDPMEALSESGLLNWLGDEDDMPGAIPATGWDGGEDLANSADLNQLMDGGYPEPALDDFEAEVDAQIEAEAARLAGSRRAGTSGTDAGPESEMDGLRMHGAEVPTDDPFGFASSGSGEAAAVAASEMGPEDATAIGASVSAPRMDVEDAELEVGPGTRDVLAAGLGRGRRRRLVWRAAAAMMGTVFLGLVGIVAWKFFAQPVGTSPAAGLVASEASAGASAESEGAPGEAGAASGEAASVGPREPEAPEPSSVAESNALLFGEAVEALSAGWPDDADDRFRLLLRSDPTDQRGMAGLASTLAQQGELEAARAMLDTLAAQETKEPSALLTLGLVAQRLGDTEGARRGLEQFIEAAPEDPRAEKVRRLLASLSAG
ncbi:MAG: tetratricopeptide repeat protein [Myxococcota bacterium]